MNDIEKYKEIFDNAADVIQKNAQEAQKNFKPPKNIFQRAQYILDSHYARQQRVYYAVNWLQNIKKPVLEKTGLETGGKDDYTLNGKAIPEVVQEELAGVFLACHSAITDQIPIDQNFMKENTFDKLVKPIIL